MQWLYISFRSVFFIPLQHSFRTTCVCVVVSIFLLSVAFIFRRCGNFSNSFCGDMEIPNQMSMPRWMCSMLDCYLRVTNFEYPESMRLTRIMDDLYSEILKKKTKMCFWQPRYSDLTRLGYRKICSIDDEIANKRQCTFFIFCVYLFFHI